MSTSVSTAEGLADLLRTELRVAGVRMRTREILPEPDPRLCFDAFLQFSNTEVQTPAGAVDEDTVQVEASAVRGQPDPTGMHSPPGAYRMTLSRRLTVADPAESAVDFDVTLELYFGTHALSFGDFLLVVPGASATPGQLDPEVAGQYDGTIDGLQSQIVESGADGLLLTAAVQGMLQATEL